jgi:hypothetical protein
MGIVSAWSLLWALLGAHQAIHSYLHPHPFLSTIPYPGPIIRATIEWALGAWMANALLGLLFGFILFTAWILHRGEEASARALGYTQGLWQGFGAFFLVHAILFWEVPAALGTLAGLRHLPMGLVLLGFLAAAGFCLAKGFRSVAIWPDWSRILGGCAVLVLLLQAPHDLFRRSMPRPAMVAPGASRLLVYSIDGCRKDVLEKAAPDFTAPAGVVPVVAVPATRVAWNLLLGGDPEAFANARVIPFQREWAEASPTKLLDEASTKGLSTCFVIDDSTTLSFGLTRAKFSEVVEPRGGWTHYFSVGAGACWPVYSWLENFLSPVETTNPWADYRAYNRDVERALERHRLVFSHSCTLHAPFFARREELQVLRPWKWFLHTAYAYQSYQELGEAEETHFDRQDGRSNPKNSYRIRMERILRITRPAFAQWTNRYPALSAVLTSDHGEAFLPIITPDRTLVNYFTGIHGFNLTPETILVPLHAFGATQTRDLKPGPFSWFDLRQCLKNWVEHPDVLNLKQIAPPGWLLSIPSTQMLHLKSEAEKVNAPGASAGMTPDLIARYTVLKPVGIWFMNNPSASFDDSVQCRALVTGQGIITFTPVGGGRWSREAWKGYDLLQGSDVSTEDMEREMKQFQGKRPERVFPASSPQTAS